MFRQLGALAAHRPRLIILIWLLLAAVLIATAPPLDSVSSTDQRDFLPDDAPFAQAQRVFEAVFPQAFGASSTVVLVDAGEGRSVREPEIWAYLAAVESWLNGPEAPDNLHEVAAPTTDPLLAEVLVSLDERLGLVTATLTTPTDAVATAEAVRAIDAWLQANPPSGFTVYQTGEAALNAQAEESTFTTMDRTLVITFALVVVALLTIYRSPVSPLIPLFSVTVAFIVTVGLIGHLARLDVITVIAQVNALLVVVMYGAGTDYCLFLISRFREEMAGDGEVERAVRHTVRQVGETIASSAGTIFVGFMAMVFAEIGMIRSAGPMLAIGIAVSLLAGLTLTPALLAVLGNRAFWPGKASHRSAGRFYRLTSMLVSSRPLGTILAIVAIMLPFSVYGLSRELNYDFVSELPAGIPSVKAYHLLRENMGGGHLFPLTVVVTRRDPKTVLPEIDALGRELAAIPGVVDVRTLNEPLGLKHDRLHNLLRVDGQLQLISSLSANGESNLDLAEIGAALDAVRRYLDRLTEQFPSVADDPDWLKIRDITSGGMLAVALRQSELMAAVEALAGRFVRLEDSYLLPPTEAGELFAELRPLVESYLAEAGTAYRLDVILDNPLGQEGQTAVQAIRDRLAGMAGGGQAVVSGFAAVVADLSRIMGQDTLRAVGFVVAGIFLVLVLMLRSLVAPLYLIATVLLSFTCTLGLTSLFFDQVFGIERLSWLLPLFMFVFLIGLGIDYSIFLFGRIKEEVAHHGIREGVHVAVAATGAIITSAAVILAGTFAGMMAGEIAFLAQMGFAVSVGVLIDAFVVRTMLDPALATVFGRWTWWPGGVPGSQTAEDRSAQSLVLRRG